MDTRVLTEFDVHWIVSIFLDYGELVSSRDRLCLAMGLTISHLEDIKFTVAMDRSQTHGFLTLCLNKWININRTAATVGKLIEVLRNERFIAVADKISEELPKREGIPSYHLACPIDPSSLWFNVPEKVSTLTGRLEEMENLHKSIMGKNIDKDGRNEITVITTLSGLGGIGKTTLGTHYAWKYFSNKFYFNVIWINAETPDTIQKPLSKLADEIELNTKGNTLTLVELASRIYKHFEQTSTLFVFDNVEQQESVKRYLPIKSPKTTRQYVLITSRNRVWNHKTHLITLNVFSEEDSVEFLRTYLKLNTDVDIELAKKIARELQNLPLAIRQAGAYIEKVCSDDFLGAEPMMRRYLDLLRTNSERVLTFECDSYEKTIYSTWKITLDLIKSQNYLAVRIMQIISYFNSDNIPIQLLENIPEEDDSGSESEDSQNNTNINESSVSEAVKLLSQFSMVTRDSQFNISVHRLVQKVIRNDDQLRSGRTMTDVLGEAVHTVEVPLRSIMADGNYERNCLVHAVSVSIHIQSYYGIYHGYDEFIDFVTSRQINPTDMHTRRLTVLLEESKYDEAEESFYGTRIKYFSEPNGEGNALTETFTVRFINCICKRIENLNTKDLSKYGDILKLSDLCNKLLVGFKLSSGGWGYLRDFKKSADILESRKDNTDLSDNIARSLVGTALQIYGILFDHFKTGFDYTIVCAYFQCVINCISYLEKWTDMLKMIESLHELSIGWFKSANGKYFFNDVHEACDLICQMTKKIDHEMNHDIKNQLFHATLKLYNEHYTFFRKNQDYLSTLRCGRGRIGCLTHLNRRQDVLNVIGDMKLVVEILKGIDYEEDNLFEVIESIIAYSNHSNNKDIKTDLQDFAAEILEMICKSCILKGKYSVFFIDTVISMLKCLTQLNRQSEMIKFGKELKSFVNSISSVELDFENDSNCTTQTFNLTEFTLKVYKLIFKFGIQLNKYELINGGTKGILECLAALDRRHEILFFC